jgi:hypothetical protein
MTSPKGMDELFWEKRFGRCVWLGRKITNGNKSTGIWWREVIQDN